MSTAWAIARQDEPYTLKHPDLLAVQENLVRKLVGELKDFDNLYYEICNEPYFGGVTKEWQHRIADIIVDAEKDFPHRHLISMNIANGRAKVTDPHQSVSIFNFHYCYPPDVVALNWNLNRVIGENETGFPRERRQHLPHRGLGFYSGRRGAVQQPGLLFHCLASGWHSSGVQLPRRRKPRIAKAARYPETVHTLL